MEVREVEALGGPGHSRDPGVQEYDRRRSEGDANGDRQGTKPQHGALLPGGGDEELVEEEEEPAPDDGDEWLEVRQLTLVEIVKTRGEALEAIAKMTTKLRYHGLPVRRLHSDQAGEFTSKKARRWAMERLITRTFIGR